MSQMRTLVDVLTLTAGWLRERDVPAPQLDAELLMSHVLDLPRLQLYLNFDRPMSDEELRTLRELMKRRGAREPLAYITGSQGFHALDLEIVPGVLVPRPDTETLVEAALEWISKEESDPVYVADVGTGSGAIGLSLAHADERIRVYATDVSPTAIELARRNVESHKLNARMAVLHGNLLEPIPPHRPVDWIVSNPPYIPTRQIDGLQPEVSRFEPRLALDGGPDGLGVYFTLIPIAAARARRGVLVEVGHDQSESVARIFRKQGMTEVRTWSDLGGHVRVVGGKIP